MADDNMLLDNMDEEGDEDLLLDPERATDGESELVALEEESIEGEQFDIPTGLADDPGFVRDNIWEAEEIEKGAGAAISGDDAKNLGIHDEEIGDEIESLESLREKELEDDEVTGSGGYDEQF